MSTATVELRADSRQVRRATDDLRSLESRGQSTTTAITGLQRAFIALGGAAVIAKTISQVREFETALIGVSKTTGLTGRDLEGLAENISRLALEIPVSTAELLELAQAAGQMGVTGAANLEKFSLTVAKLGRASNLAGAEAATALARILNVTGENIDSIDTLASVIVSLGNNVAATESEIARMTTEVARATAVFEVSSAEAAGLAAAMTSIGIRAELGGSSVGRSMQAITSAVRSGGEELDNFARTLGLNGDRLAEAFERDKLEAFEMFLNALGDQGLDAANALDAVGLGGQQISKSIIPLANNMGIYARTQALANEEVENATALDKEFEVTLSSLDSQIQISKNAVAQFGMAFGNELTPAITASLKAFNEWASEGDNLAEAAETLITVGTALAGLYGARLVASFAASAKSKGASFVATRQLAAAELEAAKATNAKMLADLAAIRVAQQRTAGFVLNKAAMDALTAAEARATASTVALTQAQRGASLSLLAGGAAAKVAGSAYALLGGPVGVLAIVAGGLYLMSRATKAAQEAFEDKEAYIAGLTAEYTLLNAQQKENIRLSAEEAIAQAEAAKARIEAENAADIARRQRRASGGDVRGRQPSQDMAAGEEELNLLLERQNLIIETNQRRLDALNKTLDDGAEKVEVLGDKTAEAMDASNRAREALEKVTQSLEDQIYQLQEEAGQLDENAASYDLMIAARQAGVEIGSVEAEQLRVLLERRNALTAGIRAETEAKRAAAEFDREQEGTRGDFDQLQGALSIETAEDPQIARIEAQLQERLALIDEYRMTQQADQEAADQAELAAFESLERQKTDIARQEAEQRAAETESINAARLQAEKSMQSQALSLAQSSFGAIADVIKQAKGEESAAYKIAYAAQQAAAIAMAYINTESAAVAAMAPPPVGLGPVAGAPYAGVIRGLGYTSIGVMAAQSIGNLATGRALGGQVRGGQEYLVGERGPELVTMPGNGNVTPYNQLMRNTTNNNQNMTQNANINFTLPQTDDNVRRVISESRDLIYDIMNQAFRRQGRVL